MAGKIDPKAAEELAKATAATKAAAEEATSAFEEQLRVVSQMRDAMKQVVEIMHALCEQDCNAMSPEKWKKVTKEVANNKKELTGAQKAAEELAKALKSKLATAAIISASALTGLRQGFKNMLAMARGVLGFVTSLAGGLFSVGKSILSIPFKMMNGLIKMAKQGGGGNELAAAYEEVRKEFGDLNSASSKAIIDTAKNMGKMNETGIPINRVFGTMAERIKAVKELAVGLGPLFSQFQDEIDKNGTAIMMYQKGLGLTNEQMQSLASNAQRMGKGIAQVQNEMTKQALGMSKAFGLNAKTISKDMGKAMQDLAHFGHLSSKEMAVTAAFAQKMGVSVDKLTGIMDATSTFDQTAEGMSKLNEQFGTNIDFTEMMSAQSPEEKVAMLSKEFAKTGKDLSKLTKQERDLIKSSAGVTDEVLNSMAAHGDMSETLKDLNKQADKNENKTLSQAEAMKELASSIDKLTPSGSAGEGGIFAHIFKGFTTGIQSTKEFRTIMNNINKVLRLAFQFGMRLGDMFVHMFPGVQKILGGIGDLFDPKRYEEMFKGVEKAFSVFSNKDLKPEEKVKQFVEQIKGAFKKFFLGGKGPAEDVSAGFKEMFQTILLILKPAAEWVIKTLMEFITPLYEKYIKPHIPKVKEVLINAVKDMLFGAFAPAALSSIVGAATALLGKIFADGIQHAIGVTAENEVGPAAKKVSETLTKHLGKDGTVVKFLGKDFLGSTLGKVMGKAAIVTTIATAAIDINHSMEKFTDKLQKKGFGPAESKIAAGAAGVINTLTLGLLPENLQEKVALALAGLSTALFKTIENWLPGVSGGMKKMLAGVFDIFGGLGQMLEALWKGDSANFNSSFKRIVKSLAETALGTFDMAFSAIFNIAPLIMEYLFKAFAFVADHIGNVFLALKDIPVVGFIFEWLGNLFKDVTKIFKEAASFFEEGRKILLEGWQEIKNSFSGAGGFIKEQFDSIKKTVSDWWSSFKQTFAQVFDIITLPYRLAFAFIKTVFQAFDEEILTPVISVLKKGFDYVTDAFKKIGDDIKMMFDIVMEDVIVPAVEFLKDFGKKVFEFITWPFKAAWIIIEAQFNIAKAIFMGFVDYLIMPFKLVADIAKNTFTYMWDTAVGFIANMIQWGQDLLAILTEPGTKATTRLKNFFEYIWEGFKALPMKLVDWGKGLLKNIITPFEDAVATIKKTFSWDNLKEIFINVVASIKDALGKLADVGPFKTLIEVAKKVFKIQSPSKVFGDIGENIVDGMNSSMSAIPKNAEKTFDRTIEKAEEMKRDMSALARGTVIPGMNIDANLKPTTAGMGAAGGYSVQGKDITINVQFNITMDVDKVEKVLITRQQSVIRDRINFLLDNTMKGNTQTANAMIKSAGEQSGNVAPNAAP